MTDRLTDRLAVLIEAAKKYPEVRYNGFCSMEFGEELYAELRAKDVWIAELTAEVERQREALKDLLEAIAGTVQINDTQLAGAYRRAKALAGEGDHD